ncbi:hypothetical protein A4A49_65559, partial [Nicotiana attenuata]
LQVAVNIISQLKLLNPDLRVDPSMLRLNARSPGEGSSAQQADVQLINRLSTGSNNQEVWLRTSVVSSELAIETCCSLSYLVSSSSTFCPAFFSCS